MPEWKIPAVFLDWAGTTVDHGSMAPVRALEDIFAAFGVAVPLPLIRKHMGLAKKDHVRAILFEPEIKAQWLAQKRSTPQEADVEAIYARFEPQMMQVLPGYADVIPGTLEFVEALRGRGTKIAGTTGYTRPMLDRLEQIAAEQGYRTDRSLAPEDAGGGRPYPWMCYRLAMELKVCPLSACIKIGDTESDIAEGLNAGMWTIGVTRSGNAVGKTAKEWFGLESAEQERLLGQAERELRAAGAHYTAETAGQSLTILEEIAARVAKGETPPPARSL